MKVVLAEKPSVARELASFLGAGSRHEGYFEGRGYQVTWALGHLVTLKEPQDYDPALKRWSLDTLPIVPDRFGLKPLNEKGSGKQLAVVRRLFRSADELICATDAGREGELIFRYINPARKMVSEHEDLAVSGGVPIVTGRGATPCLVWGGVGQ
jgi:DNA topoisomerase III